MPIATKSGAIWDLNVNIRSNSPISRLISLNHPIGVQLPFSTARTQIVCLSADCDLVLRGGDYYDIVMDDRSDGSPLPGLWSVDECELEDWNDCGTRSGGLCDKMAPRQFNVPVLGGLLFPFCCIRIRLVHLPPLFAT